MKLWIAFIPLFCSLAFADVRISNGKMTIAVMNQRLDKVIDTLRKQSDIQFYIDQGVTDQSICADFQNLSVGQGIKKMLEGTEINYVVIARDGETKAIFIGASQKPQPSSVKPGARSATPSLKQTTYRPSAVQRTPPVKNTLIELKKKKPSDRIEPVVSVPTAGSLTTSPSLPVKQKEQ